MRKSITRWSFKWRELLPEKRVLIAASLTAVVSSLLAVYTARIGRQPTLELVQKEIARGDASFDNRKYVEARNTYATARLHLDEIERDGAESLPGKTVHISTYIHESLKARIRLAEMGAVISNETRDDGDTSTR